MDPLRVYLSEFERALCGMTSRKKRRCVYELQDQLLEEADERNFCGPEGMQALLAEKETPQELAMQISRTEARGASLCFWIALLAGVALGIMGGVVLYIQGKPLRFCLFCALLHGIFSGASIFWLRRIWQNLSPAPRMAVSIGLASLLTTPLAYLRFPGMFVSSWIFMGATTGYLVERYTRRTWPWWLVPLETLGFATLDLTIEILTYGQTHKALLYITKYGPKTVVLYATLQVTVWGVLQLQRILRDRWLLQS